VEPGATDIAHDVVLPATEIRRSRRDAETGAPIAGADVAVSTSPERAVSRRADPLPRERDADRDGRILLRNLSSRRVGLAVQSKGTRRRGSRNRIDPGRQGARRPARRGLRLHGVVTDESGNAIRGAIVGLDRTRAASISRTSATSGSGEFEFRAHRSAARPGGPGVRIHDGDPERGGPAERRPAGRGDQDVQLGRELEAVNVHLEDDAALPSRRHAAVDGRGVLLPLRGWQEFAGACGHPIRSDSDGNLVLHGLPRGTIGAVAPGSPRPLGTFNNDGTRNEWTVRIAKEQ
jgi:hypothetical protein